jgi:2-polyprenyl-3-methyl-5-hydroxy-6-metoxy-1,4-benzoquinol methylase
MYQYAINAELPLNELKPHIKDIYNKVYQTGLYDPKNSVWCWNTVNTLFYGYKKALDVGCGKAYGLSEARKLGFNIYGCDIANLTEHWKKIGIGDYCKVAPAHSLPYKTDEFDLVVCSDVLEHIPEKLVLPSLKEIRRVGSFKFFLHIYLNEETYSPVKDNMIAELHITVKPRGWWLNIIKEAGFGVEGEINWTEDMLTFLCDKKR